MYSNFKEQAIEYVKQAVQEDNAGNYAKAFPLYMNALEYFKAHLKYEKNPEIREAITQKFLEYVRRAEEIRFVLDDGMPGPASNGDAAVTLRPETKQKNDGERDGEDPEKTKLRVGLNSTFFKEQAIEYVKQAVQEDNAGNYAKAFPLYMNALEYFKTHLKYEKNPKIREAISQKFTEYLRRAEEIRFVLDDGMRGPASNEDAAITLRPETKQNNDVERDGKGDGEDPDQIKLRAGLDSTIVREKPNNVAEKPRTAMGRCWPCKSKQRTRIRS